MILNISNASVNAMADALSILMDGGTVECYEGTIPADADTAIGVQTLLGTIAIPADAAPAAVDGVLSFNGLSWSTTAITGGTLQFARVKTSGGAAIFDGDIATTNAIFTTPIVAVLTNDNISMTALTITAPKQ